MNTKIKKVLILDFKDDRRKKLADGVVRYDGLRIDQKSSILREQYESGKYDIAIVHKGNTEWLYIEDEWLSPNTKIILFSGGYRKPVDFSGEVIRASAKFIENDENLFRVLEEVLSR